MPRTGFVVLMQPEQISLAPGFSQVITEAADLQNRFNGLG